MHTLYMKTSSINLQNYGNNGFGIIFSIIVSQNNLVPQSYNQVLARHLLFFADPSYNNKKTLQYCTCEYQLSRKLSICLHH